MLKRLTKRHRPGRRWSRLYKAFHAPDFSSAVDCTTDDWQRIRLGGGCKRGRNAVLVELKSVAGSFLNGATGAAEPLATTSADPELAVVTVISKMSAFTMPMGFAHRNERQIGISVAVKRADR